MITATGFVCAAWLAAAAQPVRAGGLGVALDLGAADTQAEQQRRHTVQVGAFRRRLYAERLLQRLPSDLSDGLVLETTVGQVSVFRVVSGSFSTKLEARRRAAVLSALGFDTYVRGMRVRDGAEAVTAEATELTPTSATELIERFGATAAEDRAVGVTTRSGDEANESGKVWMVFGRPLTIGGEYTVQPRARHDFSLGRRKDDDVRVSQRLEVDLLYRPSEYTAIYVESKLIHRSELAAENSETETTGNFQRGESWILFDRIGATGLSLQIGRQQFRDKREWWWDEDLDAIRVYYDWSDTLGLQVALAEELGKVALDEDHIDPEREDVRRVLANLRWKWRGSDRLELFYLDQHDHSHTPADRDLIRAGREDRVDADLRWVGLRAIGRHDLNSYDRLYYWVDGALVWGDEVIIDFDNTPMPGVRVTDSPFKRDVQGWAIDSGLTWRTGWPLRPSFTLGYAVGSGDKDDERDSRGTDHSFHQTGLDDNDGKFRGVDPFHYYGELLRPELSNLHVGTVSLGVPLFESSSLELVYHLYRQVHSTEFLRSARVRRDRLSGDRDIGQEFDIVVGLEEWSHLEMELVVGVFRAGDAFGDASGELASVTALTLEYDF